MPPPRDDKISRDMGLLLAKYRLKYWVTVVTSVMMIQSDGQIMTKLQLFT